MPRKYTPRKKKTPTKLYTAITFAVALFIGGGVAYVGTYIANASGPSQAIMKERQAFINYCKELGGVLDYSIKGDHRCMVPLRAE